MLYITGSLLHIMLSRLRRPRERCGERMTPAVAYAIAIAMAVVAGWLVPALAIRALAPSLEASRLVTENYRGRMVALGLGLVWAAWSVSLLVASSAL